MSLDSKLLETAKKLWNINDDLIFIRKVANFIYYAPQEKVYFRITEGWHRNIDQVQSELDWMFYLESKGIDFAHPIKSHAGNYCETMQDNDQELIISVFKKAVGERVVDKERFTKALFNNWGELVGKIHYHTKNYISKVETKRFEWDQEEYHLNIKKIIDPSHGEIYTQFSNIEKILHSYPKERDNYGLIHADLHTGNFHVDKDSKIMLFDFDDCLYSWFIYDIVVFLWALERFDLNWGFVQEEIFNGYEKHNHLDDYWIKQMPVFYNYRMILIHYYCMQSMSDSGLDQTSRQWMEKRVEEIRLYFNLKKDYPF